MLAETDTYTPPIPVLALSNFAVNLKQFNGPLDLLLHLVRKQELSIEDVEMSLVADQYLQIVKGSTSLDLELAAEFLVVAATLIALKSDSLLPVIEVESEDEVSEDADVYEEMRERLRLYEQTKCRAEALRNIAQLGVDTFVRVDRSLLAPDPKLFSIDASSQDLGVMFVKLLERIGESARSIRIRLEPVSIVDFMMRTISALQNVRPGVHAPKTFLDLVKVFRKQTPKLNKEKSGDDWAGAIGSRAIVVGGFISVLELVKRGLLSVSQELEVLDINLGLHVSTDWQFEEIQQLEHRASGKVVDLNVGNRSILSEVDYGGYRKEANSD